MAVQISAARCGWPQIRRFCGFERHISSNIHNFLDFVADRRVAQSFFSAKAACNIPVRNTAQQRPLQADPSKMGSLPALASSITKYSVSCCKLLWQNMRQRDGILILSYGLSKILLFLWPLTRFCPLNTMIYTLYVLYLFQ